MTDSKEEEKPKRIVEEDDKAAEDDKEEEKVAESSSSQPPVKKKRAAERQMTKDDDDDDDEEEEDDRHRYVPEPKGPFTKASEEVLSKRKIVKVRRPVASASTAPSSSNPFASTLLSASTSTTTGNGNGATNGTSTAIPTKVFGGGASFAGFTASAATSSSTTGFGLFGSSTATATSGGFGSAATTAAETTKTSASSTSLFGSQNTGFTFGFASSSNTNNANTNTPNNNNNPIGNNNNATISTSTSAVVTLPEHVELTTGEEDEFNVHEIRCKSFKWVLQEAPTKQPQLTRQDKEKDPSVKPSSNFQKAVKSSTSSSNNDNNNDNNNKNNASDDTSKQKDPSDPSNNNNDASYRWQELGVGPLKVLQSRLGEQPPHKIRLVQRRESTPNGPAHKVILNVPIWKESTCKTTSEKHLSLTTMGSSGASETYALKFKEMDHALSFLDHVQDVIPIATSCFAPNE